MQHIPTVPVTGERPHRDWVSVVAYLLIVLLVLTLVGLVLWPSLTATTTRDTVYVNPELRLAERYRNDAFGVAVQPRSDTSLYLKELTQTNLAANPELKYLETGRRTLQDFAHANPEVGLFQRLQEIDR